MFLSEQQTSMSENIFYVECQCHGADRVYANVTVLMGCMQMSWRCYISSARGNPHDGSRMLSFHLSCEVMLQYWFQVMSFYYSSDNLLFNADNGSQL